MNKFLNKTFSTLTWSLFLNFPMSDDNRLIITEIHYLGRENSRKLQMRNSTDDEMHARMKKTTWRPVRDYQINVGIQASPGFRSHQPALQALYLFLHSLLLLRLSVVLISAEYNYLDRDYSSVFLSIYSGKSCKSS